VRVKWWHIILFAFVVTAITSLLCPTRFRTAWMIHRSEMVHDAVDELKEMYNKKEGDYRTIRMLAMSQENLGNTEEAEKLFEELIEAKPMDKHFKELARFYTRTEQPKKAKSAYERWLIFRKMGEVDLGDPDGKKILNNLYAYYLADQEYKKAIEMLELKKEYDPEKSNIIANDLITLHERSGDLKQTIEHLEKALDKDINNQFALDKYIQLAIVGNKRDRAEKYIKKYMAANPEDREAWKKLLTLHMNAGDIEAANAWYIEWLKKQPNEMKRRKEYVKWLLGIDQQKLAMAYLESLPLEDIKDPYFSDTLMNLYEWNDVKHKLVDKYIERFNENPGDQENAKKFYKTLIDLKRYNEAERVILRLTKLYPANEEYAKMLIDAYDLRGDEDAAIEALEKITKKSDNPKLLKALGERYMWRSYSKPKPVAVKRDIPVGDIEVEEGR